MSDDEKPMDLRDKLAVEILNGLLCNEKVTVWGDIIKDDAFNERKAMVLVRVAYKMADCMRKVRLDSFS